MTSPLNLTISFFKFNKQKVGSGNPTLILLITQKVSSMKLFESKEYHFLDDKNINKKNNKFNF